MVAMLPSPLGHLADFLSAWKDTIPGIPLSSMPASAKITAQPLLKGISTSWQELNNSTFDAVEPLGISLIGRLRKAESLLS